MLDILAAAYAEAGKAPTAVEVSRDAVFAAKETGSPSLAVIERRLHRLESGKRVRSIPDR
jgi:hypothetical protein